jgi:hypothetical protein
MPSDPEEIQDDSVDRQGLLCLSGRLEPSHLPLALDGHEELVQVPRVAQATLSPLELSSVLRTKLPRPLSDGLVGHDDAPLGEEVFDIGVLAFVRVVCQSAPRLDSTGPSRSDSSLRLRPRREPIKVLDPHADAGNHATVIHPMDAVRNHGCSGAQTVPGARSHNRLLCLDPDGWLVRRPKANRNKNPAAELNTRAVNSLPSKTGELPLPKDKLYPLTRTPLMGGTSSPLQQRQPCPRLLSGFLWHLVPALILHHSSPANRPAASTPVIDEERPAAPAYNLIR